MKKSLIAFGVLTAGALCAQNQPDSIHIVLHENTNGNIRTLDTIVPLSQQQQLFSWMQANGWEAPPPPPPPGAPGMPMMFEHEVVIDGDSSAAGAQRMMFVTMEGDSMPGGHPQMMMIRMDGQPGELPPPPPGCQMRVITDGNGGSEDDVVFMRHPMPPPPPGSQVNVNVETKDTTIDGKTHKMIIKTERIILPEGMEAPPAPPVPSQGPKPPMPPTPPQKQQGTVAKQELLVYPNPTSAMISVEFDVAAKEKTTLRVLDMNGKVVYQEEIVDDNGKHINREINLTGKGKGTYTVEVSAPKKKIVEKVILQ